MCHHCNLLRHALLLAIAEAIKHLNHRYDKLQVEVGILTRHHPATPLTMVEEDVAVILIATTDPTVSHNALAEDGEDVHLDLVPTNETTSCRSSSTDSLEEDVGVAEPEGDQEGTTRTIPRCRTTTGI